MDEIAELLQGLRDPVPKSQMSWIWSQHPPTQWILRAADEAVLYKVQKKSISEQMGLILCPPPPHLICRLSDFTEFGGCWDLTLGPLTFHMLLTTFLLYPQLFVYHTAPGHIFVYFIFLGAVFWIHDISVWILLFFRHLPPRRQQKTNLKKVFSAYFFWRYIYIFFKDKNS